MNDRTRPCGTSRRSCLLVLLVAFATLAGTGCSSQRARCGIQACAARAPIVAPVAVPVAMAPLAAPTENVILARVLPLDPGMAVGIPGAGPPSQPWMNYLVDVGSTGAPDRRPVSQVLVEIRRAALKAYCQNSYAAPTEGTFWQIVDLIANLYDAPENFTAAGGDLAVAHQKAMTAASANPATDAAWCELLSDLMAADT